MSAKALLLSLLSLGVIWAGEAKDKTVAAAPIAYQPAKADVAIPLSKQPQPKSNLDYARMPLSFEPNRGQGDPGSRFTAKGHGYRLQLDPTGARFQFMERDKTPNTLQMRLENANKKAEIAGESPLPGKSNYFPTNDPKTWITNVPMFSRVRYSSVYPGVDVAFYGAENRLEYDFLVAPLADPNQIRMSFSGSQFPKLNGDGDLVLSEGKGSVHLLKPLVYQLQSDGKTRVPVAARYDLEKKANGEALVTFTLGQYDHQRQLVIDPVVDALSYSQYLLGFYYVANVAVDSSGNSYVTGAAYPDYNTTLSTYYAFEVSKFNSSGAVVYTSAYGTSNTYYAYPQAIAVDGSGNAYVTGSIEYPYATLPTTANAFQMALGTSSYQSFLAVIPASGGAPTYCTYFTGTDTNYVFANGVAVDSTGKVYVTGRTNSTTFPTTTGVYQKTLASASYYTGFVSKFDPTLSGASSLVYSTFLGSTNDSSNAYLYGIAVDPSGDAYVTGYATNSTYPVTSGAFQYTGVYSTSGGAYVTELNPTGTALIYSAYLGYGYGFGIAVDSAGGAYVTGVVNYADFPTTAGAYQTDYASGFAVKLNPGGATEAYSTFLTGPSGYNSNGVGNVSTIALQNGCASACNAFIAGQTTTTDFPAINAIQATPGANTSEAFIVELNSTGTSALLSSYLSGNNTGTYAASSSNLYGNTPGIAVDGSGNIYVAGNTNYLNTSTSNDFPMTVADTNTSGSYAFLAKISTTASAGLALVQPTSIAFGNQPVGVSTSLNNGTHTARLSNFSSIPITLGTITVSPSSIFSVSVTAGSPGSSSACGGNTVPAGGYCILDLNFTPNAAGARTGTVSIASNASNTPNTLSLTGSGVDQQFLQFSQSSLVFNAAVGTPSAAQTVTVTNLGDETATPSVSLYYGTNYTQTNNCPTQLPPGASCAINLIFAPTQPGLLTDLLYVSGYGYVISLSGTATVTGATTSLNLSQPSVQFGPQTQYTTSSSQYIAITNSGQIPIVIQSFTASNLSFQYTGYTCSTPPVQLNPGSGCTVAVQFTPQSAGSLSGNLAIIADGVTTNVPLSGTGVASALNVEFYPSSSVGFPDTPVGTTSGYQTIYFYNTGAAGLTLDRTVISGNFIIYSTSCEATTISGITVDGLGTGGYCAVNVQFTPASVAQGLTGTLTFYYSLTGSSTVNQSTVTLTGNGIAASGTISLNPYSLSFNAEPQGVTSALQYIYIQNPGNTPLSVTSLTVTGTNASDFSVTASNCGAVPFTISAGQANCYIGVQFTPGGTGARGPATLSVASSAGTQTATLTGTGVAASLAIGLTPTSMNLGSIVVAANGPYEYVYLRNTGTETVTFSGNPAISGTNAADFTLSNSCGISSGAILAAGSTCYVQVRFKPSVASAESATLTFTDTAGTQTLALSGTGVAASPAPYLSDYLISYNTQVVGTTSPLNTYVYFYNNTGAAITLGNIGITGSFLLPAGYDTCSGHTIANSSNCYAYVEFAPTAAGYITGTLTFNNSSGTALAGVPAVPLAGYAAAQTYSSYLSPTSLDFTAFQVTTTTSSGQYIYLYNNGNTSLSIATVSGTDLGLAGSTAEFSIYSANGGSDTCSGHTVTAGSSCYVYVTFTPNAAGTRTGTVSFPVTYSNSTTATLTANLSGNGVAEKDSAVLTPPNASFVDQTVGVVTTYSIPVSLVNSGNQPFNVGTLSSGGTNPGDFARTSDGCTGASVTVASSCSIRLTFTPGAGGARSATISFPVTFKDGATQTVTLTLNGTGVTGAKALQVTPGSLQFPAEIQTATSVRQTVSVYNTGNQLVTVGADSISGTNASEFAIATDSCQGVNLAANSGSCSISVNFTPSSSATGTQTATLNIADNAGGHAVTLTGTAITSSQQIAVSQTTMAFGNQPAGSTSSTQVVYFINQADTAVSIGAALSGSADFAIVGNTCSGTLGARGSCYVSAKFAPPSTATNGAVTGTITETDTASPGTHSISLTGAVVTAGPAVALTQTSLTFATQNVGTTSAAQSFSVTNTGTANLTITAVASTNTTEFPVSSDGCSGAVLTPGQQCVVSVKFAPSYGGSRAGSITITDNATGSPQAVALTGTGFGIPLASLSPASLTFGTTNIGTTSAGQNITLSNSGTDTLVISNLALTGPNAGDFAQTNTCGASLAHGASCTISVTFTPTAAGSRNAYVTVTDNANNGTASTQTAALTGTGAGVPAAALSPTTVTFGSTNLSATSAAQTVTVINSGTAALTIASITISGANSSDFAETNTCASSVAAGGSCTIAVTFTPRAAGSRTATLTVTDNAGNVSGSTQTASLAGTGVGVPTAGVSPASLTFPATALGLSAAAQTVTLTNSGTAPLTINTIIIGGTNSGDFAETTNCGASLAVSASCSISVTFTPAAAGTRTASLYVIDNSGNSGSTQTVALSGTGVAEPLAAVSPTSLTFSSQALNTASPAQTVTLSNAGAVALTISSIAIGGTNAADFATTNNCAGSVAAGSSCTISVTFTPVTSGSLTATLTVTDNAANMAGSTQTVALTGTGASASSATYVQTDTTTQGTWTGQYGSNGYIIANDANTPPAYATVSMTGATAFTWVASTSDPRALQTASGASTRIASAYYNGASFTFNVNLTDGNAHQIALYLLDWDGSSRAESISILDAASNAVLSTQTFSSFHNGEYAVWNVKGNVIIQVTQTGGPNAVASGLFFDPMVVPAASFVGTDTATQGTWTGVYGSNGQVIVNDVSNVPSYATLSAAGGTAFTWTSSTSDVRALQTASGSSTRIASAYYASTTLTYSLNLTDGKPHKISLYLLDWDGTARAESISILNATTNAVLSTQTFSNFHNGEYAVWYLTGNVIIQVTQTGGPNAVVSGIFFDPAPAATYVGADTTTQGTWTGNYGSNGQVIVNDVSNVPAFATFSTAGATAYTWNSSTSDVRALQTASASSTRIASADYSITTITFSVNLTDGNTHKISLYLLDWDGSSRAESITITDASTNAVLDTESYSSFNSGEYAAWNIKGNVIITVTKTGGANAVVSGLFFD